MFTKAELLLPLGEGLDPAAVNAFTALMFVMRAHGQALFRSDRREQMTPGLGFCLCALAGSDGITQKELAERMHIKRPSVTNLLQKLEKMGMIKRESDSADQRLTRIYLTESGRLTQKHMARTFAEHVKAFTGSLEHDEILELERILTKMYANVSDAMKT